MRTGFIWVMMVGIKAREVTHTSSDAINDEKRGLIYLSRVKLPRTAMAVEHNTVNLTSVMAVTVRVKTGQRRVIEYSCSH